MKTQREHEESGCTDYLQHNAESCPTIKENEIADMIHKANGEYQDPNGVWWTLERIDASTLNK